MRTDIYMELLEKDYILLQERIEEFQTRIKNLEIVIKSQRTRIKSQTQPDQLAKPNKSDSAVNGAIIQ